MFHLELEIDALFGQVGEVDFAGHDFDGVDDLQLLLSFHATTLLLLNAVLEFNFC